MSLEQPSDLELAILEHLATYRFLTNKQLLTLGVTKHKRHLQATLRSMAGLHRKPRTARVSEAGAKRVSSRAARYRPYRAAVIKVLTFGLDEEFELDEKVVRGRMPFVYTLSPQGAEQLAELRDDETPAYAPAVPKFARREYHHRLGCIDCHVAIRTWTERHQARLDFYHVDFNFSRKLDDKPISDTRVELTGMRPMKPDAIFQLTTSDQKKRLFALEFSAGKETARIERQLDKYRYALHQGAIERTFAYEHGVRVLAVFEHENTFKNVSERLNASSVFQPFSRHFLFKTLEELQSDFVHGWRQLGKLGRVPLFTP